jgi:hypothetical protein
MRKFSILFSVSFCLSLLKFCFDSRSFNAELLPVFLFFTGVVAGILYMFYDVYHKTFVLKIKDNLIIFLVCIILISFAVYLDRYDDGKEGILALAFEFLFMTSFLYLFIKGIVWIPNLFKKEKAELGVGILEIGI